MRFKNIDFLRFVLAIMIVLFHGRKLITLPHWLGGIKHCNICVDFFFIIAGFMLFYTLKPNFDTWEYAKKRFFRLAPNIWLSMLIIFVVSLFVPEINFDLNRNILAIFLIHNIGLSPKLLEPLHIIWFTSVLFWVSLFFAYISKIFEKKYLNLIIWLLIMLCYAIVLQENSFKIGEYLNKYLVLNIGVCRALASMGLGYFILMAYQNGFLQNLGKTGKRVISCLEIFIIGYLSYFLICSNKIAGGTGIIYILMFAILFYLFLIKEGVISKFLEKDFYVTLGQYAYSIFCFHGIVLLSFRKHFFGHNLGLLNTHPLLCYFTHCIAGIIIGIILYYIFEKPVTEYIKTKLKKA